MKTVDTFVELDVTYNMIALITPSWRVVSIELSRKRDQKPYTLEPIPLVVCQLIQMLISPAKSWQR